ncbi:MAG: TetR/AcrR family transcriptional regulator [Pseudomonadota bacterium]|nr:TetR/AcrR family transcriptional regulator [Pseudomonadota bacterium]
MGKPAEQRRQEIVEAALELAAEQGVKRVTTQAIADRVGIAQPTVFRHFKTRDAIFAAAIDFLVSNMFKGLEVFFIGDGPADKRLQQLITKQLGFISQQKGLPRLLFSDRLHLESPALKATVQKVMTTYMRQVANLIKEGQVSGCFRQDLDPDEASRYVAALIQGLIMRWSIFDFGFTLEEEVEPLWKFLHTSLR